MLKILRFVFWHSDQRRLRAAWRLLLQLVLFLLILNITQFVVIQVVFLFSSELSIYYPFSPSPVSYPGLSLLAYLVTAASALLSVWIAGRFFDRRPFLDFGFQIDRSWWKDCGFGVMLGAAMMACIFLIEYSLGWVRITGHFVNSAPQIPFLSSLLIPLGIFILVGTYEELLSRGYQLTNLAEGFNSSLANPAVAILLSTAFSSAFFGFLHAANPHSTLLSTLNICLAGIFLASGFILTGQLAIPIGLHISWNFFQGNVFGFPVSGGDFRSATILQTQQGGPALWTGGSFGPEGGLLGTLFPLLGTVIILLWARQKQPPARLHHPIAKPPQADRFEDPQKSPEVGLRSLNLSSPIRISHLIWDWNGTLLDDLGLCLTVINSMLSVRGLPEVSQEAYLKVFGFPVQDYYQRIGFDFKREPFEPISTEFIRAYEAGRPGSQLMKGAREILEWLYQAGIPQSILSASKAEYLRKALQDYGVEKYFCAVNGLDNHHAAGKSAIAKEFIKTHRLIPASTLLVGDTLHDAEIARELGLRCVLVSAGHQSHQRLLAAGLPVLDSLADLKNLFEASLLSPLL